MQGVASQTSTNPWSGSGDSPSTQQMHIPPWTWFSTESSQELMGYKRRSLVLASWIPKCQLILA